MSVHKIYNQLEHLKHKESNNFFLIAGPCAVESSEICFEIAERLVTITDELKIPFLFKASYRKANRSSIHSFTGIGDAKALHILSEVKQRYNLPIVTDIHADEEAPIAANVADVLQIPAFLCRQTNLLLAAAKTGKIVNIKKGQFLSPESMIHAVDKVRSCNNEAIMVTERGTSFGYQDLVVDMRSITKMASFEVPVVMDVTHSQQKPNQNSGVTGGDPSMISTIAKAAIAVGANGIFLETHPNPTLAKSDGANMLALDKVENLLRQLVEIRKTVNLLHD